MIFDLDETLIHCNDSKNRIDNVILPIKYESGEILDVKLELNLGWN